MRTATAHYQQNKFGQRQSFSRRQPSPFSAPRRSTSTKACPLCKQAGRSNVQHFLSECPYLPEQDRRYMAKIRQLTDVHEEDDEYEYSHELHQPEIVDQPTLGLATAQHIDIRQSPYLDTFCGHHTIRVTIDSGATGNMIRHSTALRLGCEIKSSSQSAHQGDGTSPLAIIAETTVRLTRKNHTFSFCGLVVKNLDVEDLAGTPFMEVNDVTIRPAKRIIALSDGTTYTYGTTDESLNRHAVRRTHVLRAPPTSTKVWPGEFVEVNLPTDLFTTYSTFALEPRLDTTGNKFTRDSDLWPQPSLVTCVDGVVRIPNLTNTTRLLK